MRVQLNLGHCGLPVLLAWLCSTTQVGCGGRYVQEPPPDPVDPPTFCAWECQRRVVLECEGYPESFESRCESGCLDRYGNYPECNPQIAALDRCLRDRVTYRCWDGGTGIDPSSTVPCEMEWEGCIACARHPMGCAF